GMAPSPSESLDRRDAKARAADENARISMVRLPPGMMPPQGNGATATHTNSMKKATAEMRFRELDDLVALPSDTLSIRPRMTLAAPIAASVSRDIIKGDPSMLRQF